MPFAASADEIVENTWFTYRNKPELDIDERMGAIRRQDCTADFNSVTGIREKRANLAQFIGGIEQCSYGCARSIEKVGNVRVFKG